MLPEASKEAVFQPKHWLWSAGARFLGAGFDVPWPFQQPGLCCRRGGDDLAKNKCLAKLAYISLMCLYLYSSAQLLSLGRLNLLTAVAVAALKTVVFHFATVPCCIHGTDFGTLPSSGQLFVQSVAQSSRQYSPCASCAKSQSACSNQTCIAHAAHARRMPCRWRVYRYGICMHHVRLAKLCSALSQFRRVCRHAM